MLIAFVLCLSFLGVSAQLDSLISTKSNTKMIKKYHRKYLKSVMNKNADPCEDFLEYSCGRWSSVLKVPHNELRYGVTQLMETEVLKALNESFQDDNYFKRFSKSDVINQAKEYYESCMDIDLLKNRGDEPLKDFIAALGSCPALNARPRSLHWEQLIAKLRLLGKDYLISTLIDADFGDSSRSILYIDQPSLEKDDKTEYKTEEYFAVYKETFEKLLVELGDNNTKPEKVTQEIFNFEAELANISRNNDKRSHRAELYTRTTVGDLPTLYPLIDWSMYFTTLFNTNKLNKSDSILVEDRYLKGLMTILNHTEEATIYNYVIIRQALYLKNFIVTKETNIDAWWKTCVNNVIEYMDMTAGFIFSRKYLKSGKRADVTAIWNDVRRKFKEILTNSTWIDSETKARALRKIDATMLNIGLPKFITKRTERNNYFTDFNITKTKFFETTMNLMTLNNVLQLADPFRFSSASELSYVSGSYNLGANKLKLSAGILQLPLYHTSLPMFQKYGVVGFILSHELAHGFDDEGRFYDYKGEANSWCTQECLVQYNKRTKCFINQYNHLGVDGNFTLGENIADNIGVRVAYLAYEDWVGRHKTSPEMKKERVKGLSLRTDQLFYLSFAQFFCEMANIPLYGDPNDMHPGQDIRLKATLSNSKEFSKSFNCTKKTAMNPIKKCKLW